MKNFQKMIPVLVVILIAGCGGAENESGEGFLAVQVENARGPELATSAALTAAESALISGLLTVTEFRLTISGEGIDESMVQTVDASATEIEVQKIPAGKDRTLLIEAMNSEGTIIRRRELTGIEIRKGVTATIQAKLNTVPVVLNLRPGSFVLAEKFNVIGFGEPGSSIRVSTNSSEGSAVLNSSESGALPVISPSLSTGTFNFSPQNAPTGRQTVTLLDENTGEESSINVYVIHGGERPGRKILSAAQGNQLSLGVIGIKRTANFPAVLKNLKEGE